MRRPLTSLLLGLILLAGAAWLGAGTAQANLSRPPPDCDALRTQMQERLRAAGHDGRAAAAALEAFAPTVPDACPALKEEVARTLRGLNATAAPSRPSFGLPNFPWPPPTASARLVLPRDRLAASLPANPNLFQVGQKLADALERAHYSEYSFFAAPDGFALTARLERIREDGTPAPEEFRFIEPGADEPFTLSSYIQRLFFAPQGFYRQIVFIATDKPFVASGEAPSAATAEEWLRRGANMLPPIYRTMPFGPGYSVTALVYEFRKGAADRDVATLTPGRLAGREHLVKAGIYSALLGDDAPAPP